MLAYLQEWITAIEGKKFLHGDQITMPDLMVFAVLRAVSGLKTFEDIMSQDKSLEIWYANVASVVTSAQK